MHKPLTTRSNRPNSLFVIEAKNLSKQGLSFEAADLCRRGLIYFPFNLNGYITLSQIYLSMNNRERALNVLDDGYKRTGSRELFLLYKQIEKNTLPKLKSLNRVIPKTDKSHLENNINEINDSTKELSIEIIRKNSYENNDNQLSENHFNLNNIDKIFHTESTTDIGNEEINNVTEPEEVILNENYVAKKELFERIDNDIKKIKVTKKEIPTEILKTKIQPDKIQLSIHTSGDTTRLRSSNIRLIPGLEYAPLRYTNNETLKINDLNFSENKTHIIESEFENSSSDSSIGNINNKELLEIKSKEKYYESLLNIEQIKIDAEYDEIMNTPIERELSPLEELAKRLETARIPMEVDDEMEVVNSIYEPTIVTETWADILVNQGAFTEALKAYQILARSNPNKFEHYKSRIDSMKNKIINTQLQNSKLKD